jgi:glycosyltransferase involved in cell wall biosynthesis
MSASRRPRVLLAAYQCGPAMGSVSQIGWEWYQRLSRQTSVTLLTHVRNRPALEAAGAPLADSEVVYVDTEWLARPLFGIARKIFRSSEHAVFMFASLDFFAYDRQALALIRQRMAQCERWDVIHAVTPVTTVAASRLYLLGIPVILGPLNSGLDTPRAFHSLLKADSVWLYPLRNIGRVADRLAGCTRNAAMILTATRATAASIAPRYRSRCVAMLENGVDLKRFPPSPWPPAPVSGQPLRALFVGRLVPFKGVTLLLDALAAVRDEINAYLSVVGEGPMRRQWEAYARRIGVADRVEFCGAQPLDEVAARMRAAHVFCLPSVRESGGAVLLEAMASARPVIAVNFGGPAEIVDEKVGRLAPADGPRAVTAAFAQALREIVATPDQWRRKGEEGRRRAERCFSWDAKIEQAMRLYRDLPGAAAWHARAVGAAIS